MSTLALVSALKDHSEDFEFYPTTNEMLSAVRKDIQAILSDPFSDKYPIFSALDVGAGDGRNRKSAAPSLYQDKNYLAQPNTHRSFDTR